MGSALQPQNRCSDSALASRHEASQCSALVKSRRAEDFEHIQGCIAKVPGERHAPVSARTLKETPGRGALRTNSLFPLH
jgi:hypothetical protein